MAMINGNKPTTVLNLVIFTLAFRNPRVTCAWFYWNDWHPSCDFPADASSKTLSWVLHSRHVRQPTARETLPERPIVAVTRDTQSRVRHGAFFCIHSQNNQARLTNCCNELWYQSRTSYPNTCSCWIVVLSTHTVAFFYCSFCSKSSAQGNWTGN